MTSRPVSGDSDIVLHVFEADVQGECVRNDIYAVIDLRQAVAFRQLIQYGVQSSEMCLAAV